MDRTRVCGIRDRGSIPREGTCQTLCKCKNYKKDLIVIIAIIGIVSNLNNARDTKRKKTPTRCLT